MTHKSKKKHVKHQHDRELELDPTLPRPRAPGTKAASAAAGAATSHKARLTAKARAAAKDVIEARSNTRAKKSRKRGGVVRSIARAATKKIAAKPKGFLSRAKARVRSLFGRRAAAEA